MRDYFFFTTTQQSYDMAFVKRGEGLCVYVLVHVTNIERDP